MALAVSVSGSIRADRIRSERETARAMSQARAEGVRTLKEGQLTDLAKEQEKNAVKIASGKIESEVSFFDVDPINVIVSCYLSSPRTNKNASPKIRAERQREDREVQRSMSRARADGARALRETRDADAAKELERLASEGNIIKIGSEVQIRVSVGSAKLVNDICAPYSSP